MSTQQSPSRGGRAAEPASGSMVRRILLGSQLRRLRESRGVTREAAGYSIRSSESKISRMELGRVSFKPRDVADLLTLYGVTEKAEREPLLALARSSGEAGWWHNYHDLLPNWFQTFLGLEAAASRISSYEVQFVPGLLQTEAYASAMVSTLEPDLSAAEAERRVALRLSRQKLLDAEQGPQLHCVMDEAALRRPYGSRDAMCEQARALADLTEHPRVTLQVMPFEHGSHAMVSGAFVLLGFAEEEISDVTYLEHLTSALYLDKPEDVAQYRGAFDGLTSAALPPDGTRKFLHALSQDL